MSEISIFKNKEVKIDIPKLADTRMLIMANSGGGKSYAVRKIVEETSNKIMTIIIDVEGEFKTLREKYDFLLVGDNGDVELNPEAANLLPKKLMELNVSTIIDISDLSKNGRIQYVKKFLEALMGLPRKYWKPLFLVLDEIHNYAGQQDKHDSGPAVIDLSTRGRKRGYCLIGCTQRIVKLHKDVAAECNNVMIGRTWLKNDSDRAADIIGRSKKDMEEFRKLKPGEFYIFGPAIEDNVSKEFVAETKTTHPKVGMDVSSKIIAPTKKIKSMLNALNDLPKEAKKKLRTEQDLKKEVNRLKRELVKILDKPEKKSNIDPVKFNQVQSENIRLSKDILNLDTQNKKLRDIIDMLEIKIAQAIRQLKDGGYKVPEKKALPRKVTQSNYNLSKKTVPKSYTDMISHTNKVLRPKNNLEEIKIPPAYMRLLKACASAFPNYLSRERISFLANVPIKASTFRNGLSFLKTNGLINSENGNGYSATDEGVEKAGNIDTIPTDSEGIIRMWCERLPPAYTKMFTAILEVYPNSLSREEISLNSGVDIKASTFRNGLSKIKTLGLITKHKDYYTAADDLFD